MDSLARPHFESAIQYDPGHEAARRALGVKPDEEFITTNLDDIEVPVYSEKTPSVVAVGLDALLSDALSTAPPRPMRFVESEESPKDEGDVDSGVGAEAF